MKIFPVEILKPLKGTINALIFENTFINLPKTLFFQIEIPLEPIDMAKLGDKNRSENHETSFRLDSIKLARTSSLDPKTEKYCDLYAVREMLKLGYNPSQIGRAQIFALSHHNTNRKNYLVKKIVNLTN